MHWNPVVDKNNPRKHVLELHASNKYSGGEEYVQAYMKYEDWLLGGCSTAGLWGFSNVSVSFATEEVLAELVRCLRVVVGIYHYNPRMVFCQVPAGGQNYPEAPFFKLLREMIYPEVQPVFTYPNRSHESTEQRLYYFDTDVMYAWLENYDATHQPVQEKPAVPVVPNVGNNGTIINQHRHDAAVRLGANQAGQRPIAPGEYFAALARR